MDRFQAGRFDTPKFRNHDAIAYNPKPQTTEVKSSGNFVEPKNWGGGCRRGLLSAVPDAPCSVYTASMEGLA